MPLKKIYSGYAAGGGGVCAGGTTGVGVAATTGLVV